MIGKNDIVVLSCSSSKRTGAGHLKKGNQDVMFVSHPKISCVPDDGKIYAHPDDFDEETGKTWRDILVEYNDTAEKSSCCLLQAYKLYQGGKKKNQEETIYEELEEKFKKRFYILSAGWGLIRANYLLPNYNITFSDSADCYKKRCYKDNYSDFQQLPKNVNGSIHFVGSKSYRKLFAQLSNGVAKKRYIWYRCDKNLSQQKHKPPKLPDGISGCPYPTKLRMHWHYECIENKFL